MSVMPIKRRRRLRDLVGAFMIKPSRNQPGSALDLPPERAVCHDASVSRMGFGALRECHLLRADLAQDGGSRLESMAALLNDWRGSATFFRTKKKPGNNTRAPPE
jgi:hypothetical protein